MAAVAILVISLVIKHVLFSKITLTLLKVVEFLDVTLQLLNATYFTLNLMIIACTICLVFKILKHIYPNG